MKTETTTRPSALLWPLLGALTFAAACATGQQIRLQFPESEPAGGPGHVCGVASAQTGTSCAVATTVDRAAQNQSGTVFVNLPPECNKSFHQITIRDAGSDNPTAHVICAPVENAIQ